MISLERLEGGNGRAVEVIGYLNGIPYVSEGGLKPACPFSLSAAAYGGLGRYMVYGIIEIIYGNAGYRNGGRYGAAACVFGNAIALYYGVCKTESAYFGLVMDGVALYRVNNPVADEIRYCDMVPFAALIGPVEEYQIAAAGSVVPARVIGEVAEVVGIILDTGIAGVAYYA